MSTIQEVDELIAFGVACLDLYDCQQDALTAGYSQQDVDMYAKCYDDEMRGSGCEAGVSKSK